MSTASKTNGKENSIANLEGTKQTGIAFYTPDRRVPLADHKLSKGWAKRMYMENWCSDFVPSRQSLDHAG
jgi:hypothetical protein